MISVQKKFQFTGHNSGIYALEPGPEPGSFLSAAGDGWIVQWQLDTPDKGQLLAKVDTQVFSLCYLPGTHTLVAGDMNGGVHWLNLNEHRPNRHLAHHQKGVYGVLAIDGDVFTIGGDGVLTRWDKEAQRSIESVHLSAQALRAIDFSATTNQLSVGSSDHSIYLLDRTSLAVTGHRVKSHENSVFSLQFHQEGQLLFSGGRDAHLKVWRIGEEWELLSSQPGHWFTINDLILDPQKRWLISASRDKTVKFWDPNTFELLKVLETARDGGHINSVNRLLWLPGTNCLASCSDDRSIIIWEVN